jgi:acyl-[acyl-carrier-protein]-phospholipid O-acyltransferase/long-chain-fatty-acid--[acyl-carrier-protein] ligase
VSLLSTRRFLPLFLTQFLGAFNDNLLKNALVMLVTYRIATQTGDNAQVLVTLAGAIFILPYFLFSATAGQLADKFDRAKLTRIIKIVEIGIMVFATLGFVMQNVWFLMFVLFCMGMHSTFFGPIKYALLPQHLGDDELLSGNAYIESGTFLAILLGTILGGVLILQSGGTWLVSLALLVMAGLGYVTSRSIPPAPAPEPQLALSANIWQETWRIVGYAKADPKVYMCVMGISWFWLVGATFLSQFPPYVKDVIGADASVVTLFLTVFSVGIGIGTMLCNRLLRGHIQSTYVPLAALGISFFGVDLYFASGHVGFGHGEALVDFWQFVAQPASWRVLFDLLMIAVSSGVYIVPLYAIMQHRSAVEHQARIIAANNIINALFMVASALATLAMLSLSFSIPQVFLAVALANGLVAIYICRLLPDALLRSLARSVLGFLYRVEVRGMEHYHAAGERVLIIANHTSFIDAALIAAYLPEKITFAVNTHIARIWWIKPLLGLVDAFPLDPVNPLATKSLIDKLKHDNKCMIFPEGRITVTGSLMKIYEGPGMIADKSGAQILPIRIDGAQYTPFSRLKGKMRLRCFPKITITILPPCTFDVPDDIKGRKRRQAAGAQLYDLMSQMMFDSSDWQRTLFSSLIAAQATHGRRHPIAEDIERSPLTYGKFITRAFTLGHYLNRAFHKEPIIGLLLPTAVSTSITFFGLQAYGRIPAMLNFTAGGAQVVSACQTAGLTTVITSRRFVQVARLEDIIGTLEQANLQIAYLEDMRPRIRATDKLFALAASYLPRIAYRMTAKNAPDAPAVILFTSGSEGTPKGVVLSHTNIQANRYQLSSRVDFGPQDIVFNCLPMFHAFGLMGGTLLPILSGIKTFYYPSPLHYRIVPELIYDTNSTILFGTDTFLSGYARFAHPYDLHSIRYVFSGAEKLKEETRKLYGEKFGVRIFEGYGATETAPVISTNTPMQNRPGSVGRLMPGIEYKLEPVPGIEDGAKLWVKGANVMRGYLYADNPGRLAALADGWYDTGDVVAFDAEGYITIKGRTKRFAKIAGEMVSLAAVETMIAGLWQNCLHAVVTVPDDKKGEQIVLITNHPEARRDEMVHHFREQRMTELAIPKRIIIVKDVPMLGTGKIDYQTAKKLALADN